MTVSAHGRASAWSPSHSNVSSITTERGIAGAESPSSRTSSRPGAYASTRARSNRIGPSIAFAYGSISSFAGLKRCPAPGSQGPVTR